MDTVKDNPPEVALEVPPVYSSICMGGGDRNNMNEDGRIDQDGSLAMGMLPEVFELIQVRPRVQTEHELFRGLRQLKLENEQPFWLTFAFQFYLDMRHILRGRVDQGFKDLCREARLITNSVNKVLNFHREMGIRTRLCNRCQTRSQTGSNMI